MTPNSFGLNRLHLRGKSFKALLKAESILLTQIYCTVDCCSWQRLDDFSYCWQISRRLCGICGGGGREGSISPQHKTIRDRLMCLPLLDRYFLPLLDRYFGPYINISAFIHSWTLHASTILVSIRYIVLYFLGLHINTNIYKSSILKICVCDVSCWGLCRWCIVLGICACVVSQFKYLWGIVFPGFVYQEKSKPEVPPDTEWELGTKLCQIEEESLPAPSGDPTTNTLHHQY